MAYCKKCGVELENGMQYCPLCGQPIDHQPEYTATQQPSGKSEEVSYNHESMSQPQKRVVWEIISTTILSLSATTLLIDLVLSQSITWSKYPLAFCLVVFAYISFFAFLRQNKIIKTAGSLIVSSILLLAIDMLTGGIGWATKLGIPILFSGNVIAALLIVVIIKSKKRGINTAAYTLIAAAAYCLCIEGILSCYSIAHIQLHWSIIIVACALPVSATLFFVHYRLTKNQRLERTFHL